MQRLLWLLFLCFAFDVKASAQELDLPQDAVSEEKRDDTCCKFR